MSSNSHAALELLLHIKNKWWLRSSSDCEICFRIFSESKLKLILKSFRSEPSIVEEVGGFLFAWNKTAWYNNIRRLSPLSVKHCVNQNIFYRKEAARPWAAFFCLHEKFSCDIITAWTMDLRCSHVFLIQNPAACRFDSGMSLCYSTSHNNCVFQSKLLWNAGINLCRKWFRAEAVHWKNAPFLFARLNPVCYNIQVLRTFYTH